MVVGELAEPVQVLVIGGGPGGYTAAARAAELGLDVVLVESGALGGVCLNVGCIPSKVLTSAAHDLARAATSSARGVHLTGRVDLPALQSWREQVVDRLVSGVAASLARVRVVSGTAFFLGRNRVSVDHEGGVSHFRFDDVVIATGSRPLAVPGLPVDGHRVLDSTGALALTEVPADLAVVGAGYVGMEIGTAFARFGSRVTLVEATDTPLAGFDRDVVQVVLDRAVELGVSVRTRTTAHRVDEGGLHVSGPDGESLIIADRVLVAVGREPVLEDLQLDQLGLTPRSDGRLEVNAQQRTSAAHVFAVGDVAPGPALAHKAMAQGRVAAEAIAGLPSGFDAQVPLIAFTEPELASVGLTEQQAREQGLDVVVGRARFAASGRAVSLGEDRGLVKVVSEVGSDLVLGVHLVGPSACDLVGEAALAVETGCRVEDLVGTVHPHPTLVESIRDAALTGQRRSTAGTRRSLR